VTAPYIPAKQRLQAYHNNTEKTLFRRQERLKLLLTSGIVLAVILAYTLALGKGGLLDIWNMQRDVSIQQEQNERLQQRNRELAGEVVNLQKGTEAIEERARSDLGLIRPDEVFVQIIE
jgi:cell division protein FtsB